MAFHIAPSMLFAVFDGLGAPAQVLEPHRKRAVIGMRADASTHVDRAIESSKPA